MLYAYDIIKEYADNNHLYAEGLTLLQSDHSYVIYKLMHRLYLFTSFKCVKHKVECIFFLKNLFIWISKVETICII